MENNKIKGNKKLIISIAIIILLLLIFGGTFAYYSWYSGNVNNTAIIVSLKKPFKCIIDGGGPIESSNYSLMPTDNCMDSNYAIQREIKIESKLDNPSVNSILFDVWIDVNKLDEGLSNSEHFKYALTTSSTSCTEGVVASGNFKNLTNNRTNNILSNIYNESTEQTYYLYVWLGRDATSETMNQQFSLSLNGQCTDEGQEYTVSFDLNGGDEYKNVAQTEPVLYTTAGQKEYTTPSDGIYKLEVWGAQGGSANSTYSGGYGGHSVGTIELSAGTKLFANVGGSGSVCTGVDCVIAGGYNGGGNGVGYSACGDGVISGSGGGATHIATTSGLLSSLSNSKDSILIVAGGGGGGNYCNDWNYGAGGSGGGIKGVAAIDMGAPDFANNGGTSATGGTQTSGFSFGQGGSSSDSSVGGGGGYYGGKNSGINGAGGGSGYIGNSLLTDKAMYCYNCTKSTAANTLTNSTTYVSGTPTSGYAKSGNGAARITLIKTLVELEDKTVTNGLTYGTLPTPTSEKSNFVGWNTEADGTGTYVTETSTVKLKKDTTLYAIWSDKQTYTISYNANGGSGAPGAQIKYHDADLTLSGAQPTRSGYIFAGWNTSSSASTVQYKPGTNYTGNESITLYAVWKQPTTTSGELRYNIEHNWKWQSGDCYTVVYYNTSYNPVTNETTVTVSSTLMRLWCATDTNSTGTTTVTVAATDSGASGSVSASASDYWWNYGFIVVQPSPSPNTITVKHTDTVGQKSVQIYAHTGMSHWESEYTEAAGSTTATTGTYSG